MKITTVLAKAELHRLARAVGIELHNYRGGIPDLDHDFPSRGVLGPIVHHLQLAPAYGSDLYRKRDARERPIKAVDWAGHYVYLRALLIIDPDAVIESSARTWPGAQEFAAHAYEETMPRDVLPSEHVHEDELIRRAREAAGKLVLSIPTEES